jgi:hypothetical protein
VVMPYPALGSVLSRSHLRKERKSYGIWLRSVSANMQEELQLFKGLCMGMRSNLRLSTQQPSSTAMMPCLAWESLLSRSHLHEIHLTKPIKICGYLSALVSVHASHATAITSHASMQLNCYSECPLR